MSSRLHDTLAACRTRGRCAFVAYVTAGYPTVDETVPLMLAMEASGADVLELGVPFNDAIADGPTLQKTGEVALRNGVSVRTVLDIVSRARLAGLAAPVVLMGYFNPVLAYGEEALVRDARAAGADGFILADVPLEESLGFAALCRQHSMSLIPLVTITTTDERLERLAALADPNAFVYCVSVAGITGARDKLPDDLPAFVERVRGFTEIPLAVGFGVSTRQHVEQIAEIADGVIVGTAITKELNARGITGVRAFIAELSGGPGARNAGPPAPLALPSPPARPVPARRSSSSSESSQSGLTSSSDREGARADPDMPPAAGGGAAPDRWRPHPHPLPDRFGQFGGQYVPETFMAALEGLEKAYVAAKADPEFLAELKELQESYAGRATPLHLARRLSEHAGGARIWIKREDLCHTGSHKINSALGQALLAKRMGLKRVVAESASGRHGVAVATCCAILGLKGVVYMGAEDMQRQSLNVLRMRALGAEVLPACGGRGTLKDALDEALRDCVTNIASTFYMPGSCIGPHPYPTLVRDFQSVIGREARAQMLEKAGRLPGAVVACVGGGSSAVGAFQAFLNDPGVRLIGCEAAGKGLGKRGQNSAPLLVGHPGVFQGMRCMLLQDCNGQVEGTHSIGAGLDYPAVGPELCWLQESGRAEFVAITDAQALEGYERLARLEGIIPGLEPAHAVFHATQVARELGPGTEVLVVVCGRGDKDVGIAARGCSAASQKLTGALAKLEALVHDAKLDADKRETCAKIDADKRKCACTRTA